MKLCTIDEFPSLWQAEAMAVRREEALDSALALQPQLTTLISDTKELQAQVCQLIVSLHTCGWNSVHII